MDVREAVERAASELDGLRGVVTSAGIFHPGDMQPLAGVELANFEGMLRVNLVGIFLAVKYALPHLVRVPARSSRSRPRRACAATASRAATRRRRAASSR
jgi:NAD(P)-dependent dehydrogenase (short-subunit alcohol dehydrogenase family)